MNHPKMKYTYVGIDSHKHTHTAVFINCFFEKLGEIQFNNLPSEFYAFLKKAMNLKAPGTELYFGLEDVSMYGRLLAVFLKDTKQHAKHVNAIHVAHERRNQTVTQKTDAIDAECAARVLLSKFNDLPSAEPDDKYWILQSIISRREFIIKNNAALKNHLHSLITQHYPNYKLWFPNIDSDSSLAFLNTFPSPMTLDGVAVEALSEFLREASKNRVGAGKKPIDRAKLILGTLQDTTVPYQEIRDKSVQSTVRQITSNHDEVKRLEKDLARFMENFECTLTSMSGIDTIGAAQFMAHIGDIKRFPSSAKLARYAGIAPVTYASGQSDRQYSDKRGNRALNALFHMLAVRLISTNVNTIQNTHIYDYYHRKLSDGKTKMQALKCVKRRLVNIIWGMLTRNEVYVNPPVGHKKVTV